MNTYQKLKKSLTSFSLVWVLIPLTWTVFDMLAVVSSCVVLWCGDVQYFVVRGSVCSCVGREVRTERFYADECFLRFQLCQRGCETFAVGCELQPSKEASLNRR